MHLRHAAWAACCACAALLLACGADSAPTDPTADGPRVAIDVAALNLQGVGDVVWDLQVESPSGVVWQRRVTSSGYGDGAGSASYVGSCDADPANPVNTVSVWVVGVYQSAVSDAGAFQSGSDSGDGAVTGTPVAFQNPTTGAALSRTFTCRENQDVAVQFDVALMRPAQQGFFDIAVNLNNIFCSAKLDCCKDTGSDGCATDGSEDIALLFDAGGARSSTFVMGFACTAGTGDAETELYLDPITLDCSSPSAATFSADIVVDPAGAQGNQCVAGSDGMSQCAAITEVSGDADAVLFQVGVYRGLEQLTSGGAGSNKVYWNIALGVKRPAITGCWLRARGTADDANGSVQVSAGTIAAGAVYPYVQWDADLAACAEEPLTFGDDTAMVRTAYTSTGGGGASFAYGFGPNLSAGPFCDPVCLNGGQCVSGDCVCAAGFTGDQCETNTDPFQPIGESARLDGAAYLARTPSTASDRRAWTFSTWVKRGALGTSQTLFGAGTPGTGNKYFELDFLPDDTIRVAESTWGVSGVFDAQTTAVFRDAGRWYHVVLAMDTDNATYRLYVDGAEQTMTALGGNPVYPSAGYDTAVNTATLQAVGSSGGANQDLYAYLAETILVDGQALAATDFGGYDANGRWIPRTYQGGFGTNGFQLDYANDAALGEDASGGGNDLGVNGTLTQTFDSPTDNFCVLNRLEAQHGFTMDDGNLTVYSSTSGQYATRGTIAVTSGKWYWEAEVLVDPSLNRLEVGAVAETNIPVQSLWTSPSAWGYVNDGTKWNNGPGPAYGDAYTVGDVIGTALDMDAGTVEFYKNGVSQGVAFTGLSGKTLAPLVQKNSSPTTTGAATFNFGATPFAHAPPAGFSALSTGNLPTPAIAKPSDHFDVVTYSGTGAAQSVASLDFAPDLVWTKDRTTTGGHALYDSSRGAGYRESSHQTQPEAYEADTLTGFTSNGFSLGADGNSWVNHAARTYVAWTWRAGGAPVANTDGAVTSQVSVDGTAGFSVATYAGTGGNTTTGHGLGAAPDFIIWRARDDAYNWDIYHSALGYQSTLIFTTAATRNVIHAAPTATTMPVTHQFSGGSGAGQRMVAYAWRAVEGYSAFGSYSGNASSDGPFVYTGFEPRYVLLKRTSSGGGWHIFDAARDPHNLAVHELNAENSLAEGAVAAARIDLLFDGFKLRSGGGSQNGSGATYVYAAFAELPIAF